MQEQAVLGQLVLAHSPIFDVQRRVIGLRLAVLAAPDAPALSAPALLQALQPLLEVGPPLLLLNLNQEAALLALLAQPLPKALRLEVPAFLALAHADVLRARPAGASPLLLKGASAPPLPADLREGFSHALLDEAPAKGAPAPHWRSGIDSWEALDDAFARQAQAACGWPLNAPSAPATQAKSAALADVQVVMELMRRVDRGDSVDHLEAVLKNDATLAFRLLRYLNSAAFGLRVEVTSFRHALMMLGHQRLKRWLALLLVSAHSSPRALPLVHAALRRGLFMERLAAGSADEALAGELFICGVFSVLDRLLGQPFAALLASVPVSAAVRQALAEGGGPHAPYLHLACAVEQAQPFDIREAADALMLGAAECNRALLAALVAAQQLT